MWQLCKTLIYTLLLMITIALTVTLMTVSDRLLAYAVVHFRLPVFVAVLWGKLRFPIIAVVGYFALLFLYAMAAGRPPHLAQYLARTLAALGAWLALSWLYAW